MVSGLLKLIVALSVVVRLFVPMTFIVKPSMFETMAFVVVELMMASFSVRTLLVGSYFTVPLTPSKIVRLPQLSEGTFPPAIVRS